MSKVELIIRRSVVSLMKFFHIRIQDKTYNSIVQFVKFCAVGLTNTALSYIIIVFVLKLAQPLNLAWDYVLANIVSFVITVAWSCFWNNRYVFTKVEGATRNIWGTLIKSYLAYGITGILLTNFLSYIWIDILGISKYISPLINLAIKIPLNYIINKRWVYKQNLE